MSFARRSRKPVASLHLRRTLMKTEKIQKRLQTLCDDSCSPSTDPKNAEKDTKNAKRNIIKSNHSSEYISSSAEETNLLHQNKKSRLFPFSDSEDSESSKEFTQADKQKTNTRHKKVHSTVRKEKNSNTESECSDSEVEVFEKSIDKKEKRHAASDSASRKFSSRFNEEADSSSGKEFQPTTKLSRSSNIIMKKLSEIKEDYTKSNSESTRCRGGKTINEKQCLRFKTRVTKILNKFKEVCSEYELQMESVKWKHLKKELMYQEAAKNIIDKSKDVISKLKMELDAQEKELITFYSEWSQKNNLENDDDSSSSEIESLQVRNREKTSDHSESKENLLKDSAVSDCDNAEIFSTSESEKTEVKKSKNSKHLTRKISSESPTCDDEENVLQRTDDNVSPVLGSMKAKKSLNETHSKMLKTIDTTEANSTKLSENERINDSLEDMFEDIISESVEAEETPKLDTELDEYSSSQATEVNNETEAAKCDSNKDENLLENKEQNAEPVNENSSTEEEQSKSLCSQETVQLKNQDTKSAEPVKITESEISLLDEEEKAKRALLESDSESLLNEESLSERSNRISIEDNLQQNPVSQAETEGVEIEENKTKSDSIHEDSSSDQQNEIEEISTCAEQPSSDTSTENSARSSAIKKSSDKKQLESDNDKDMLAKAKLLNSSNSEISNSETDDEVNVGKQRSRNKQCEKDSLEVRPVNFDISVSERVKKRRVNSRKKYDIKTEEKLQMQCRVVLERLPEKTLKKYKAALSKSEQYLKDKEIENLLDVDRLQKDSKAKNNSVQCASPKKKTKAVKEAEETLLDHLKKVENGECSQNVQDETGAENTDPVAKPQTNFPTKEELMIEADNAVKKILLNSDTDIDIDQDLSENSSSEKEKKSNKKKDKNKKLSIKSENDGSTSDKDDNKEDKSAWRRHKLLRKTLSSDSDSDVDKEMWERKQKNAQEKTEENNTQSSDAKGKSTKRKRRNLRKILDSDSDVQMAIDSDSSLIVESDQSSHSVTELKKARKRKTRKSSNSDSSLPEKRGKQKRKRIKNMFTDSGSSSENDITTNSQGTPGKKGRKNIRKVIKDKQVADDTKQAAREEEERMKRIAERQKLYNEMYEARLADEEKVEKLVLDFDPETKEDLLSVHTGLVKRLKPHQAKGIKFMWDSCFESLERMKSSSGSGCIIAHCMGLGKTLQVISLIHTILSSEKIDIKTIMVVCPLSTVLNWVNEFKLWFKYVENGDDIEIYELTRLKKNIERKYQLESWQRTGGVLIIGYEMFRNLSGTNNKMRKSMKESVLEYLVDPGPDLIVCDEGHLLKNEDTALSKSMRRIKTLRRIVLTGTPLQNNLTEYHCMVQFVKPNLLGTKKEFLNRFVNPITNGQFDDSTEYDVKLMKKRAYVLHKMLKGCVQRFDYSVLTPFLPPKQEYVIFVRLTDVQIKTYRHYLENFARKQRTANGSLFADFQALQRIWTHPLVLKLNAEKMERINEKRLSSSDSEGSLKDFIDDGTDSESETTSNSSGSDESVKSIKSLTRKEKKRSTRRNEVETVPKFEEPEKKEEEWWSQFTQPEHFEDMKVSAKLVLLFSILKECEQIGDKVLVFSQSLYSLTLIEKFLEKIDNETQEGKQSEYTDGHSGSWSLGLDYFRLDGQTPPENRSIWCKIFNQPSNTRARLFLISTRAGGLGINLTAANRVIIFDASWNPSHDVQSIFRIYRFGQKKPCYVYRFLAAGTMEEKIYNRQVTKLSLACRVVDEQQIERHYSNNDLSELYNFDLYTDEQGERPTLNLPKDRLLAEIFLKYKDLVETYHEHDSLLENKAEEELNEEERKQAWLEYEEEKKGKRPMPTYQLIQPLSTNMAYQHVSQFGVPTQLNVNTDYEQLKELIRKDYPNATPEQQQNLTARAIADMYSYFEQQTYHSTNRLLSQVTQNAALNIRPTMIPGVVTTAMPTAMPSVATSHLRMQVPNFSRMANTLNVNNVNSQVRNERPFSMTDTNPKSGNVDDDIVEVFQHK